ncbi:MAG: electron transfer flavoprotein subunit alpha/FixB family protein [Chloroflexi bacterium]|nr:electron transfer flavoprotein subunit alpha/FixB family protein [Chloroflexota bacterium]
MPNNILTIAEHRDGALKKVSYELLGEATRLAAKLGGSAEAALLGQGIEGLAASLAQYGAQKIYLADDPVLERYSPETYAQVVAELARRTQPVAIFLSASTWGKDLGPRIAAKLWVGLASDCTRLELEGDRLLITRPIFAGKIIAQARLKGTPQMATLRPNLFPPLDPDPSRSPSIEKFPVDVPTPRAVTVDVIPEAGGKLDVAEAEIIVSGGRGMKGPENYKILEELAEALGGAVGASRAAVDAGWRPHADQVGQTGKTVTPTLYIACGISGAIQHLAGMKTAKYIVAINKDREIPLFKLADYGIVGDLFEIVPLITQEVKKLKQEG